MLDLDKRILPGKRPLTCFDIKEAEQFRGKDGYFAHEMEVFENLDCCYFSRLLGFDTCDKSIPFAVANASRDYEFFIPEEWIKEPEEKPEKKYRAFTIKEFQQKYSVGSVLKIRQKQNRFTESVVQYVGYKVYEERIYLGITDFTLDELFENFEMIEPQNDTWHPFGVIDEDKE